MTFYITSRLRKGKQGRLSSTDTSHVTVLSKENFEFLHAGTTFPVRFSKTSSSGNDFSEGAYESRKKHRKDKKRSKSKKEKRHKKKIKRRKRMSTSTESASSQSEAEWVEKRPNAIANETTAIKSDIGIGLSPSVNKQSTMPNSEETQANLNDWSNFDSFIPTYDNSVKREKRQTKKKWDTMRSTARPGQHSRELNPYWKDGGDGLPPTEADALQLQDTRSKTTEPPVGDSGLHWLKKAYQRAKEQALEEGRSLEDVAAERWGSLSNFNAILEEAEDEAKLNNPCSSSSRDHRSSKASSFRKPRRDSNSDEDVERDSGGGNYSGTSLRQQPKWMKSSASSTLEERRQRSKSPPSSPSSSISQVHQHLRSDHLQNNNEVESSPPQTVDTVLTDQEMNSLSAKILKAEMLGNSDIATKLKAQHLEAEKRRQDFIKSGGDLQNSAESSKKVVTKVVMDPKGRRRDKPSETHRDGQRVRYFPDDEKQSLQNMFQREKTNTAENENALFSRLAGKGMKSKPTDDHDLDDIFADKASSNKNEEKDKQREVNKVINDEKFYNKKVDDCPWCFDGKKLEKHIVATIAEKSYLCVPPFQSLTEGHCLIVPMFHVPSVTYLDEDVWNEMQIFRRALVRMFKEHDQDLIIFENVMSLYHHPHMYLECVPIPKETGELAPIYFKKAIQECESEWSQNKKLVELKHRGVRKCIPKGLPYFAVDFGDDNGFAHVIEDEKNFPKNFAQEIIGGMMELDHSVWRKRKNDNFKEQREKLMKFLEIWVPFDWTRDK